MDVLSFAGISTAEFLSRNPVFKFTVKLSRVLNLSQSFREDEFYSRGLSTPNEARVKASIESFTQNFRCLTYSSFKLKLEKPVEVRISPREVTYYFQLFVADSETEITRVRLRMKIYFENF